MIFQMQVFQKQLQFALKAGTFSALCLLLVLRVQQSYVIQDTYCPHRCLANCSEHFLVQLWPDCLKVESNKWNHVLTWFVLFIRNYKQL